MVSVLQNAPSHLQTKPLMLRQFSIMTRHLTSFVSQPDLPHILEAYKYDYIEANKSVLWPEKDESLATYLANKFLLRLG